MDWVEKINSLEGEIRQSLQFEDVSVRGSCIHNIIKNAILLVGYNFEQRNIVEDFDSHKEVVHDLIGQFISNLEEVGGGMV